MTADKPPPFMPKLRFPEFAQGPGWDHVTVADLVETVTPPKKLTTSTYLADGRFPIIDQSQSYICGWTNDDEAVITKPLPVIVFGDHTCVLKFVNRPFAQGADGIKILTARRRVSTLYLYHQLTCRPVVMEEYKRHFSVLKDKVVCFPDPKSGEQQKIADCLGSLDDLVAAEGRKLDALRQHKQGLMQQLFPQPGETAPRLRFPEFHNDPEWEGKELGDVSEVLMCKRIFASETNPNGGVPFYKIGTLGGVPDAFISKDLFEEYKSKYNFPRTGEVLITCSGTVGKCLPYDGSEAYFQDSNIVWIDNSKLKVSNEFLLSILSNVNWSTLNSTTITRIYGPDLRGLAIKFPQNEKEQKCIADCLFSVDDLISAQAENLVALQTHKEGLLQQLFPSLESQ